jgi:hypothetical protein
MRRKDREVTDEDKVEGKSAMAVQKDDIIDVMLRDHGNKVAYIDF